MYKIHQIFVTAFQIFKSYHWATFRNHSQAVKNITDTERSFWFLTWKKYTLYIYIYEYIRQQDIAFDWWLRQHDMTRNILTSFPSRVPCSALIQYCGCYFKNQISLLQSTYKQFMHIFPAGYLNESTFNTV